VLIRVHSWFPTKNKMTKKGNDAAIIAVVAAGNW
jgi:hypothetical protein